MLRLAFVVESKQVDVDHRRCATMLVSAALLCRPAHDFYASRMRAFATHMTAGRQCDTGRWLALLFPRTTLRRYADLSWQKHVDHHFFPRFMSNDTVLKREHWCVSAGTLSNPIMHMILRVRLCKELLIRWPAVPLQTTCPLPVV